MKKTVDIIKLRKFLPFVPVQSVYLGLAGRLKLKDRVYFVTDFLFGVYLLF